MPHHHSTTNAFYNVFAGTGTSGNTAEVIEVCDFNDSYDLSSDVKVQAIVRMCAKNEREIKFYSNGTPVPLCIHGTLASSRFVCDKYKIAQCSFRIGNTLIRAQYADSKATCSIAIPQLKHRTFSPSSLSTLVSLIGDLHHDIPIMTVDIGSPKLFVCLSSQDSLYRLKVDQNRLLLLANDLKVTGAYFYYIYSKNKIYSRSFNPHLSPMEDPATGIAAGALVYALAQQNILSEDVKVYQGNNRNSLCLIDISCAPSVVHITGKVEEIKAMP